MAEAKVWNLALIPSRQHRELSLTPCLVSVLGLAKSWRASYCNSADIARGTAQPWLISTQVWIMAVGGFFVLLGVWSLGWRVIRTVGSKIATVDFHTAWCVVVWKSNRAPAPSTRCCLHTGASSSARR